MDIMIPLRTFDECAIIPFNNSPGQPLGHLMNAMIPFRTFDGCYHLGHLMDAIIPFRTFDECYYSI